MPLSNDYGVWAYVGLHRERSGWLRDPVTKKARFYPTFTEAQAAADAAARRGVTCHVKRFCIAQVVAHPTP